MDSSLQPSAKTASFSSDAEPNVGFYLDRAGLKFTTGEGPPQTLTRYQLHTLTELIAMALRVTPHD
jgi:hypothetical protein